MAVGRFVSAVAARVPDHARVNIDLGVYSRHRLFRTAYSSKLGCKEALVPSSRWMMAAAR